MRYYEITVSIYAVRDPHHPTSISSIAFRSQSQLRHRLPYSLQRRMRFHCSMRPVPFLSHVPYCATSPSPTQGRARRILPGFSAVCDPGFNQTWSHTIHSHRSLALCQQLGQMIHGLGGRNMTHLKHHKTQGADYFRPTQLVFKADLVWLMLIWLVYVTDKILKVPTRGKHNLS